MYQTIRAEPLEKPYFVWLNHSLADRLGIENEQLQDPATLALLAGNCMPDNMESIALAYAGHQFGTYVPELGDGRALMLGEIKDAQKIIWDIQLKGSGRTRYSRSGDGRAPLSAVVREAIISEAMNGFGIPSTRVLAIVGSKEKIYRAQGWVPAAVLTRVAKGHLRVGSFQFAAAGDDTALLKTLADYAISRHFPVLSRKKHPYPALFAEVLERQAKLVAQWMGVGFIHGVMNTDNMSITGETLDYGPCAFMDEFSWNQVFSSIDQWSRYAYGNQPNIAYWNCMQFAKTLAPLLHAEDPDGLSLIHETLQTFPLKFQEYWLQTLGAKLGLIEPQPEDAQCMQEFLTLLQKARADFTNTFRLLSRALQSERSQKIVWERLGETTESETWIQKWLQTVRKQSLPLNRIQDHMNTVNPAYIPRNHRVEQAINAVVENKDTRLMEALISAVRQPYTERQEYEYLQELPEESERVYQTFCGT